MIIVGLLLTGYLFSLPSTLFTDPVSTVLVDREGNLLSARIARDEQWRFPESDSVPKRFEHCVLQFEDAYFYQHPGINPISFLKALWANITSGGIKRGGSTITMQTIRLSRKNPSRTILEKLWEMVLATRLELRHSKKEILNLYASHAPFGGNVVGLEAASWRYFNRPSHQLSWAESATLAVLPNAPALIFPGKNHVLLEEKRNRLLDKLRNEKIIDSLTCSLSKLEPLPQKPFPLPQYAPHLLQRVNKDEQNADIVHTTLDVQLQQKCNQIISRHHKRLVANHIFNAAIVVLDVETGAILAYVGNTEKTSENHGQNVDIITSSRSTGSLLKPLLYASCLQDGSLLPNTLVADVPTQISGYSPQNYGKTYAGAVPAHRVIARSLNVPSVLLLKEYKYERFHFQLQQLGMSTLTADADRYGLSLILGGAEGRMDEMCGIYASLARRLIHYAKWDSRYFSEDLQLPFYIDEQQRAKQKTNLDAGSIWLMFNAMKDVHRPYQEQGWEYFGSSQHVGWKTGTSFGNRDAWAIGVTPKYVVGVWVGNADGEGRPEMTGVSSAAPIMFDVFNHLPNSKWFDAPYDALREITVCKESGHRPSPYCTTLDSIWVQKAGLTSPPCPYHQLVHLDQTGGYQVNSNCAAPEEIHHQAWFVLPPIMEWYYKQHSPHYLKLPPFKPECQTIENNMDLIYPRSLTHVYVPIELSGKKGKVVFELAHRKRNTAVYWHLDNEYLGQTSSFHQMAVQPPPGKHKLTVVDALGERLERWFEVVE